MTDSKLGEWRWYLGCDEHDDEMIDCGSREQAIKDGRRQYAKGEAFYIVEARMHLDDEQEMADGQRESAPFALTRNGEWIDA